MKHLAVCLVVITFRLGSVCSIRDELFTGEQHITRYQTGLEQRTITSFTRQALREGSRKAESSYRSSAADCASSGALYASIGLNVVLICGIGGLGYKLRQTTLELEEEKDQHMKDTHDFLQRLQMEKDAHEQDNNTFLQQLDVAANELDEEQAAHLEDNTRSAEQVDVAGKKLDREKLEHEYDGYRLKGKQAQYLLKIKRLEKELAQNVERIKSVQQFVDTAQDDMNNALTGINSARKTIGNFADDNADTDKEQAHWVWRVHNFCGARAKRGSVKSDSSEVVAAEEGLSKQAPSLAISGDGETNLPEIAPQFRGSIEQH